MNENEIIIVILSLMFGWILVYYPIWLIGKLILKYEYLRTYLNKNNKE